MSNSIVLQTSSTVIEEMKKQYKQAISPTVPQGGIFMAKVSSCTITAYKSGKVMFQGGRAEAEASRWQTVSRAPKSSVKKSVDSHRYAPPASIGTMSIIGSDEVGTGDYFGPMTVVAAYVDAKQIPLLKELGVKDSKNLNDAQIIAIAKQLLHVVPYSSLVLHNEKYNELFDKGNNQGKLKALLHNKAITNLLGKIAPTKPDGILIDQFTQPNTYYKYLTKQKEVQRDNVYFATKGESIHLAVAAASILARYSFVKQFDKLSKKAGMQLPKGAGMQVDIAAAKLIQKLGKERLPEFVKLHFANTEKAFRLLKK
ncbi:ribonuclease HIII [Bacillus cytotoxicus]|uniref:ribonuclease HIII n=1 Tax=Bacillus cereus group sp. BfR-BA-01492 TaxID=2920361 RepID=UPI001F590A80|nr:ribonuclease HIII [Bacillus cereus group sp. BfR-BA-01492]EMA6342718.1 ribonuclease HIII [Bacillus cytotoxicus]